MSPAQRTIRAWISQTMPPIATTPVLTRSWSWGMGVPVSYSYWVTLVDDALLDDAFSRSWEADASHSGLDMTP